MRFDEAGLDAYLKEIEGIPLLTAEEEQSLARRVAKVDPAARERMIRGNLRLVVHVAGQYSRRGVSMMDLIAEGNIGLMKAVERYRAGRHTRFSTYATWWIRQHIRRALQTCGPTVRVPGYMVELVGRWKRVSRDLTEENGREPTERQVAERMEISPQRMRMIARGLRANASSEQSADMSWMFDGAMADQRAVPPDVALLNKNTRQVIKRCLDAVSHREAEILRLRFGLESGDPLTLEEVGKRMKLTRERVRQIEVEALQKLAGAFAGKLS